MTNSNVLAEWSEGDMVMALLQAIALDIPVLTMLLAVDVSEEMIRRDEAEHKNSVIQQVAHHQRLSGRDTTRHTLDGAQDTEQFDGDRF